ncbi:MAG: hypothetical protein Q8S03_08175 [Brevundimonas sp.]|uniref:hypothetical protein n=1 Tax=Brevundimonas sp. TaxID=1871086 RepID=UPI00273448B8|nr:hypothetical protein [Brevundimonas sp.]MBX9614393.1 hypothetical protein [Caulobacteraceae bacterium]MDP3404651.1 hypothetical protein [Brevundimonas sp.]
MSNNFRPTTLERAYELARSGDCRTVSDIKARLQQEGHERVQDRLYGGSLTSALRKLCVAHYVAPEGGEAPTTVSDEDEDGDDLRPDADAQDRAAG